MHRILSFLLTLSLALTFSLTSSFAEVSWRMAHKMPPDSPEGVVFQKFSDLVDQYSNGEMKIKMFPNEQLGKTDAIMEQLQIGTVQMYAEGSTYMKKWVPEITWTSPAFLFDDRDHWVRFMNTDMVKGWYDRAAKEVGVMLLGDPTAILRGPYRVMVTTRDVKEFADMKGLKLRMHPNKDAIATWTTIGADVKTLAWTDVYQSIQKGIVDAVNSPIALVESMRFNEVAPHIIKHDEYYQSIGFMVHKGSYDNLSDNLKAVVDKAYADTGTFSFEVMNKSADLSILRMKAAGVTMIDIDRAPFVSIMADWYKEKEAAGELPEGFLATVIATK